MNILLLLSSLCLGATVTDLDPSTFEVDVPSLAYQVRETRMTEDERLWVKRTFPRIDACIDSVYATCGIALRPRRWNEAGWPTVADGHLYTPNETRFGIAISSPPIHNGMRQSPPDQAAAAKMSCIKGAAKLCGSP